MGRENEITYMLTFECARDLLQMVEQLDPLVPASYGGRDAWLSFVVATAVEQFREHGMFFPQDNQETIDELIGEVDELQCSLDQLAIEIDEVRQRANGARSNPDATKR